MSLDHIETKVEIEFESFPEERRTFDSPGRPAYISIGSIKILGVEMTGLLHEGVRARERIEVALEQHLRSLPTVKGG